MIDAFVISTVAVVSLTEVGIPNVVEPTRVSILGQRV
jgi:hypothetical protein